MNSRQTQTWNTLRTTLENHNIIQAIEEDNLESGAVMLTVRYSSYENEPSIYWRCRIYILGTNGGIRRTAQVL